ncbi:MAG: hypothetical protein IPO95_12720 [Rhodanobacteraceae bacterium]|nr:hypothetical protein [Rhodanobacteraceae bacterium]
MTIPTDAVELCAQLQSGVSIPPGERPLGEAIAEVLGLPPALRADVFAQRVHEIAAWVAAHHPGVRGPASTTAAPMHRTCSGVVSDIRW